VCLLKLVILAVMFCSMCRILVEILKLQSIFSGLKYLEQKFENNAMDCKSRTVLLCFKIFIRAVPPVISDQNQNQVCCFDQMLDKMS